MRLEIQDVTGHSLWVAKVDAFLHEAEVVGSFGYDDFFHTFSQTLRRVGHEFAAPKLKLGPFAGAWSMPRVSALLSLSPVEIVEVVEHREPRKGVDQLEWIAVVPGPEVEVRTKARTVVLRCLGATALRLADIAKPEPGSGIVDLGSRLLPSGLLSDLSAVAAPGVADGVTPPRPAGQSWVIRIPSPLGVIWRLVVWLFATLVPLCAAYAVVTGHWLAAGLGGYWAWRIWHGLLGGRAHVEASEGEAEVDVPEEGSPPQGSPVSRCPGCHWECYNGNVTRCAQCGSRLEGVTD